MFYWHCFSPPTTIHTHKMTLILLMFTYLICLANKIDMDDVITTSNRLVLFIN